MQLTRPRALRAFDPFSSFFAFDPFEPFASDKLERRLERDLVLSEEDDKLTLSADLPGVPAEALDVRVDGRTLRIEAKLEHKAPEGYVARRVERARYTVSRELTLGADVDESAVSARLKNGVLTITLPKRAKAEPKKIAVVTE